MVTKAVSDQFGGGGIADQMIKFNGYPLLENHDHAYGVPGAPARSPRLQALVLIAHLARTLRSLYGHAERPAMPSLGRHASGRAAYVPP